MAGSSVATGTASTTLTVNQAAALSFSALGNTTSTANISAATMQVNGTAVSTSTGANPTATIGTSATNGSANTFMRSDAAPAIAAGLLPSIATTTKTIYDIAPATTDYPSFVINSPATTTIKEVDCFNDNAAGNTFTFNIVVSSTVTTGLTYASSSLLFAANQTCTATSTASVLTSFANATIGKGQTAWLWFTAASSTAAHVQISF